MKNMGVIEISEIIQKNIPVNGIYENCDLIYNLQILIEY